MAKEQFRNLKNPLGNISAKLTEENQNNFPVGRVGVFLKETKKATYKSWGANKKYMIERISAIVKKYREQDFILTSRQMFYQLVKGNIIANDQNVYKLICNFINTLKYAGILDWDSFEDRGRVPKRVYFERSVQDALKYTRDGYRLNRMDRQPVVVQVWSEKDAISAIIYRACKPYGCFMSINKGFTSGSALYKSYKSFAYEMNQGKKVIILYFGDHDASGLDMIRDIRERLTEMMVVGQGVKYPERIASQYEKTEYIESMFEVKHIGLTMEQIQHFDLPANTAKESDPRAKKYIEEHGHGSWEVDALEPQEIINIISREIEAAIDMEIYNKLVEEENADVSRITKIVGMVIDGKFDGEDDDEDEDDWDRDDWN